MSPYLESQRIVIRLILGALLILAALTVALEAAKRAALSSEKQSTIRAKDQNK